MAVHSICALVLFLAIWVGSSTKSCAWCILASSAWNTPLTRPTNFQVDAVLFAAKLAAEYRQTFRKDRAR